MPIKNSHLIGGGYPYANIFLFVNGVSSDQAGTPTIVAWALEEIGLRGGWQEGSLLGTESDLIENLSVSRDTLREAIRVIEARGSMQMQRGCRGGLRLLRPRLDDVAAAFAAQLRSRGFTPADLAETTAVAEPIFAVLDENDLIVRLYRRTVNQLSTGTAPGARHAGRAGIIAEHLTRSREPVPENGIFLGDEAALCEKLDCTRPALREALRVLGDHAMLKIQRGRGGGFSLVRPSPSGTVRQLFGLLASRHQTLKEIVLAVSALNLIRLRLAGRKLSRLNYDVRKLHCNTLISSLDNSHEPHRWFRLHATFDQIANNAMISALADSFMAYHARLGPTHACYSEIDAPLRANEEAIIQALHKGDYVEAECRHLALHNQISKFLNCPDFPDFAQVAEPVST